ncbi:MAG: type VI secretion system baseplate subunit TssF [Fibrobacteria bacterium]|nr:type VI secretion system baseplate subunit TssF [Fibrobacteria bacterium]
MPEFNTRFLAEMRSLEQDGQVFSEEHPESAYLLSKSAVKDRDPYVERLFEGFAYLSARIRETLDLEEDGIALHVMEMLEPGIGQPLPSVCMVELVPSSKGPRTPDLAVGAEVLSRPVVGHDRPLRFLASSPRSLLRGSISSCSLRSLDDGTGLLEITIKAVAPSSLLVERGIDLFLAGDAAAAWALQHALLRHVESVETSIDGGPGSANTMRLTGADETRPLVWPHAHSPSALLGLRDFLCHDEGFRFVRLEGSAQARSSIQVKIKFRDPVPRFLERSVGKRSMRLNSAVFVNAFETISEPIHLDHRSGTIPVVPLRDSAVEVLDILDLSGTRTERPFTRTRFTRLSDYEHASSDRGDGNFYSVLRTSHGAHSSTSVSLGGGAPEHLSTEQVLTAGILACDGSLPRDNIQASDINRPGRHFPVGWRPVALSRPTPVFRPASGEDLRSVLLGHLQRSFLGLNEAKSLKGLLRSLDWDQRGTKSSLIERIHSVDRLREHKVRGGVRWPLERIVIRFLDESVAADSWERLGMLDAFGRCLHRLFQEELLPGSDLEILLQIDPAGVELLHQTPGRT